MRPTPLSDRPHATATKFTSEPRVSRRRILQSLVTIGVGSAVFNRALAAIATDAPQITPEMIQQAEWVAGVEYSDEDRALLLEDLKELLEGFEEIRKIPIDNGVPPALYLRIESNDQPARDEHASGGAQPRAIANPARPDSDDDLAFASVATLGALLRSRRISSAELTGLYLERLKRYDPLLRCVIALTEESALRQAKRADQELAAGRDRGPLHGIPWGAKDLLAFPGYRTTWGAKPFKDQVRDEKAAVIERLEAAGAVLVVKLSVGALAWGDVWFDATTKNPWNPEQGSSGSSAGPASATAAGLVGFALGTETWGSIVSPCTRCGATGMRPTFGRVSRYGCMALSWSMDKIGPITRSVEDCALVFDAIRGRDGRDHSVVDRPFTYPLNRDVRALRVGYVESLFDDSRLEQIEKEEPRQRAAEQLAFDRATLDALRELGVKLTPIKLPVKNPIRPLSFILSAEASAAFDELTRSGRDDELVRQVRDAWPNVFRQGQLIPAVEYIRANRIRTLLMREMEYAIREVDVYVTPSFGGDNLLLTNLTGHPCVVLPNGFRDSNGTPTSITFTGRLHGESELVALADAYQRATVFHLKRPKLNVS